jgi:diaminopropionate ammonia-lyase
LAAAVAGFLWEALGACRPVVAVVEPTEADCIFETALAGRLHPSRGTLATAMSCLACRDPSTLAWRILDRGADAFLTVPDYAAVEVAAMLARGEGGDSPVRSQPSGVAGVAGLVAASFEPTLSGPLGLGRKSVVLVFGSEGPEADL